MRLRHGRKVPRNIYLHDETNPDDDGFICGQLDSHGLADFVVHAVNALIDSDPVIEAEFRFAIADLMGIQSFRAGSPDEALPGAVATCQTPVAES